MNFWTAIEVFSLMIASHKGEIKELNKEMNIDFWSPTYRRQTAGMHKYWETSMRKCHTI